MKNIQIALFLFFLMICNLGLTQNQSDEISRKELFEIYSNISDILENYWFDRLDKELRKDFLLNDTQVEFRSKLNRKYGREDVITGILVAVNFGKPLRKGFCFTNYELIGDTAFLYGYAQSIMRKNDDWDYIVARRYKAIIKKENGKVSLREIVSVGTNHNFPLDFPKTMLAKLVKIIWCISILFKDN